MPRSKTSITGDAGQVRALLTALRADGIRLMRVSVGSCSVEVAPDAPVAAARPREEQPDRETIYRQFGGDVLRDAVVEGEEFQPVVARR